MRLAEATCVLVSAGSVPKTPPHVQRLSLKVVEKGRFIPPHADCGTRGERSPFETLPQHPVRRARPVAASAGGAPKAGSEDGRCPARTGDLLLVRREHLLRSTAVCRSGRSASDGPRLAAAALLRFVASTALPQESRGAPALTRKRKRGRRSFACSRLVRRSGCQVAGGDASLIPRRNGAAAAPYGSRVAVSSNDGGTLVPTATVI